MTLLTIILFAGAVALATCQSDCEKFGQDNTMCIYPDGSGCTKIERGVDQATIETILHEHNARRQTVANGDEPNQPSAANMYQLTWDADLAAVAQRWADQCQFGHDENRGTPTYRRAGQNVATSWGSSTNSNPDFIADAIAPWYNEVSQFSSANINPFSFSGATGHYTQVCWAETRQVGCGYALYNGAQGNTKLYVCNYGPAGNIIGGSMYTTGQPCSECTRCSIAYNGLCRP